MPSSHFSKLVCREVGKALNTLSKFSKYRMRVKMLRRQFPRQWLLKQTIFVRGGDGLFGLAGAGHVNAVTSPRRLLHDAAHAI